VAISQLCSLCHARDSDLAQRRKAGIRVALAGCGRIAFLLERDPLRYKPCTHLGALRYFAQKDKAVELVAFCDTDLARADAAAEFMVHGGTEVLRATEVLVTQSFSELLKTKPDLLVIAASTAAHFSMLTAALKARIPRIIVEKPVAFSADEAQKLRRMVQKSSSVILPNYERRYHPKYIRLKQQISRFAATASYRGFFAAGSSTGGALGRSGHEGQAAGSSTGGALGRSGHEGQAAGSSTGGALGRSGHEGQAAAGKSLYATKNGDEGVLLHDTTHLLDLAQYLFGPVKKQTVVAGKNRHVLHLEHAGGASGLIETNVGIGAFHLELEVRLPDRRITVGNGFHTTEKIAASRHYRSLKSYAEPQRSHDAKFPVTKNPFVQLYREALYGKPDNGHFFEALDNVRLLSQQPQGLLR